MQNIQLMQKADEIIAEADKYAIHFTELSKLFEEDLSRSGSQSISDLKKGHARLGGIIVPLSVVKRTIFIDNYESFYAQSLRILVEEFIGAKSLNSKKLLLRAIIESVYYYSEPSLVKITATEKSANRFRYMQVMFFYFLMAKNSKGSFITDYLDFLKVAKDNLPAQKMRFFPGKVSLIDSSEFSEKNILKCIEQMAIKKSTLSKPVWYDLLYGDMSLLAHGNPFGVVTSEPRSKQKREACLLLSVLLNSLSEVTKFMAENPDISHSLKDKLLAFSGNAERFYKNDMKTVYIALSKAQI